METLLTISLPFFALVAAGYAAGHFRVLDGAATAGLNAFVFWFALPTMLFMKMSAASLAQDFEWRFIAAYSGGGLLAFILCVVAGRLLFRPSLGESAIMGMGAGFGNVGYMGLPIVLAVFGDKVVLPAVLVIVFDHIILLPITTAMIELGAGRQASLGVIVRRVVTALARNPLIISTFAGLLWGISGLHLALPVAAFGNLLANAAAPCALFAIGATLVGRPLHSGFPELALISVIKLLVHPALAFGIATLLALDPLLTKVAVLEASLPLAANVFIMARAYNVYVERASSAILLSTICAVFTVSALLALLGP